MLAEALADRKTLPDTDMACRVTAAAAIAIFKPPATAWLAGTDPGPNIFGKAAFAALRRVVC